MNEDILAKLRSAKTETEREWLAMQFTMDSLAPEVREAIWAAAAPHFFDADLLNALLDNKLSETHYNSLVNLSFIESFTERGYSMHERTRSVILGKLWRDDRTRYREYNQNAADYYKKQNTNDFIRKTEEIYHARLAGRDTSTFS